MSTPATPPTKNEPKQAPQLKRAYAGDDPEEEDRQKPITAAMTYRLMGWLKPYRRLYVIGAACGVLAILCDLVTPLMIQRIIDNAIPAKDATLLALYGAIWAGLAFSAIGLDVVQIWATNTCGERVITDLRMAVFQQLQRLSMSFYDKTKLGRIITRGTSDMNTLRVPVISGVNTIAFNTLLMIGAAGMILWTDWRLFLAVVWLAPVLALANNLYRRRIGEQWQITHRGYSRVAANLAENITGVRVVSAFNRQDENLEHFNELQEANTNNNVYASHINGVYQPFLQLIKFSGQMVLLTYGGYRVWAGGLEVGQLVAVLFYWDRFMDPTINMGNFYNTLMQAMASAERVFALLDLKPDVVDRAAATPLPAIKGNIRFDHVTFGYDPARPVLHDICFDVPAGQTFALVGHTGCGKSSTVSLLARFYEPQQGRILVDGLDTREHTMESLHTQMGLVSQINYLFSGTVLDNIRYPRPHATDDEVYAAAKALGIHETILSLQDGYQTLVGERGGQISLGIRQLVCFTRVLLANPSIFLLDEATSSIDVVTEAKVQAALETLVRGRTTVIVAHRLSTIVKADCIVVLDQGRIIEMGTHAQLLENKGHYAGLYRQFAEAQSMS
jgi:ABC-type multidrug transport system fused ATPase/permease subunit